MLETIKGAATYIKGAAGESAASLSERRADLLSGKSKPTKETTLRPHSSIAAPSAAAAADSIIADAMAAAALERRIAQEEAEAREAATLITGDLRISKGSQQPAGASQAGCFLRLADVLNRVFESCDLVFES